MSVGACMGGWCSKRRQCPHHEEPVSRADPAERLCLPGQDGIRLVDASPWRAIRVDVFAGQEVGEEALA